MIKSPPKQKINKLFYGKWPYKIGTRIDGGHLIKRLGIDWIAMVVHDNNVDNLAAHYRKINFVELLKFARSLEPYLGDKIKIRVFVGGVDIYIQDKSIYEELQHKLQKYVREIFEPVNAVELDAMLSNNKIILRDSYPKEKYKYKIIFKTLPISVRESLSKWIGNYKEGEVYASPGTLDYLRYGKGVWTEHYIYVKDNKMVTMVLLASQGYIRRTEEYVLRSSINTSLT
jgi:hypothetical protein